MMPMPVVKFRIAPWGQARHVRPTRLEGLLVVDLLLGGAPSGSTVSC
jgi:hypothetical protein